MREPNLSEANSKKIAAGLCGILLGGLGIHKFILGYSNEGLIMILVTFVGGVITCGGAAAVMGIIGLVEGIIYLTKTDEEFYNMYMVNKKGWF
jgi:TM2 domain-containing membrane protein YozV